MHRAAFLISSLLVTPALAAAPAAAARPAAPAQTAAPAQAAAAPPAKVEAAAGTPFAYDRSAPLALETQKLASAEQGVDVFSFSFASPKGGRATGRLVVPQRQGKKAGVVFMHGSPGSAEQAMKWLVEYARAGAVVLAVDAPFARRGGQSVALTVQDRDDQVQLVVDLQRAVDVLLARPDVDPSRIAFVGGSYGGAVGAAFAGVDPRPVTYVLFVADGGLVSHFTSPEDGSPDPQGPLADLPRAELDAWLALVQPVQGIAWVGKAKPGSILFLNGLEDPWVTPGKAKALHRAAGPTHAVRWYPSGHKLPEEARRDMRQWLHERIGTDAPAPRS
jgi:dienelactone hydrolase